MKFGNALLVAVVVLLAGCKDSPNLWSQEDYFSAEHHFQPICLDGVEYWVRANGNKAYLAVRIDPRTLQPRPCKEK